MNVILAIDLGTTSIKCAVFSFDGRRIAAASEDYKLNTPDPCTVEVDVEVYWSALKRAIASILSSGAVRKSEIASIGFSVQGETLVSCDSSGNALHPAIVWLDTRAGIEAAELRASFDAHYGHSVTGQVEMLPHWPAAKILWLQRHRPHTFERTAYFLLLGDYILFRMTGELVTNASLACTTYYLNIESGTWWPEMLDVLRLRTSQLPTVVPSGQVVGTVRKEVAADLGLPPNAKVVTGGMDLACGAVGTGSVAEGIVSETTGAALAVCAMMDGLVLDKTLTIQTFPHVISGTSLLVGFATGGMTLRWFRDFLRGPVDATAGRDLELDYDQMVTEASKSPPGSNGLLMLPYLGGAQAPDADPNARGVFYGFSLSHTRADFTRSIIEAICYVIRRNLDAMGRLGLDVKEIRASGGAARSTLWKQIEADITNRPVKISDADWASCRGAAALAGVGTQIFRGVHEASEFFARTAQVFTPNPALRDIYDERYAAFLELRLASGLTRVSL